MKIYKTLTFALYPRQHFTQKISLTMSTTYNRPVYLWLFSGVALISIMVVIGGITRLTDSGLSMSDWNLLMGSIPPLNETEWQQAFERYQEFPQFQQLNSEMNLNEFKQIFFWEYFHRLIGRLLGIIFIVPFIYFWAKGYFDKSMLKKMWILLALGASQGAMGWIMVKSGLVDIPYVNHYRLAAHLSLAFILVGYCFWLALDVRYGQTSNQGISTQVPLKKWLIAIGILFWVQMLYGAFTAGLDAGYMYNTFPKMAGEWIPPTFNTLDPFILNLFENPGTVQWLHRLNGTLLLITVAVFWWKSKSSNSQRVLGLLTGSLLGILCLQYLTGIFTLVYNVPTVLGVIHQTIAILFWGAYLAIWHHHYKRTH
jgi:cytochrome c oxidase assembly protein subunit 15